MGGWGAGGLIFLELSTYLYILLYYENGHVLFAEATELWIIDTYRRSR